MTKARKDGRRNLGLYSGSNYAEYRYGPKNKKAEPHKPIYSEERRKSLISQVMDVMQDWRFSPFEYEATIRHSLRQAMCIKGYAWSASDIEASQIVAHALKTMRAVRPDWIEGQWHYAVAREDCAWCSGPIDEQGQGRGERFCSPVCAKSAYIYRDYEQTAREDEIGRSAYRMIVRSKAPVKTCDYCNQPFQRFGAQWKSNENRSGRIYCSIECKAKDQATLTPVPCECCGREFQPLKSKAKYCSRKCSAEAAHKPLDLTCKECGKGFRRSPSRIGVKANVYCSAACSRAGGSTKRYEFECTWCNAPYVATTKKKKFCSNTCACANADFAAGRWKPRKISGPIFDHVFTKPINARWERRLTPQRLDWLFINQGLRVTMEVAA